MARDISIIIATYNRAEELARTLKAMVAVERKGLSVELIIVDNGSTDQTQLVSRSASSQMPIHYLFEPRPGKSAALNTALESGNLGNIVVFTDDDVEPSREWLVSIASTCERWPKHAAFGGRIDVLFPQGVVPKWAFAPYVLKFAFGHHDYSDQECVYEPPAIPFGANFWVKKEVFHTRRRFNEAIGARHTNTIRGEDTLFLLGLVGDGYDIVYSPTAVLGHRVAPHMLKIATIYRRAYQMGRGIAHVWGVPHPTLLDQLPVAWKMWQVNLIVWNTLKILGTITLPFEAKCRKIARAGYHVEALRLGLARARRMKSRKCPVA
jgi:glycosyltransferase involved in cell wall biosynthesis